MSDVELATAGLDAIDPSRVTLCEGGPALVRGISGLTDAQGNPIESQRPVVALCRCGKSGLMPMCDGTHKIA